MKKRNFMVIQKLYSDITQLIFILLHYVKPLYIGLNVVMYFKNKIKLR
jgi:hypothetical protein